MFSNYFQERRLPKSQWPDRVATKGKCQDKISLITKSAILCNNSNITCFENFKKLLIIKWLTFSFTAFENNILKYKKITYRKKNISLHFITRKNKQASLTKDAFKFNKTFTTLSSLIEKKHFNKQYFSQEINYLFVLNSDIINNLCLLKNNPFIKSYTYNIGNC